MPRVTEDDVALVVLQIAANQANGICTFYRARAEVPQFLKLSAGDLAPSSTRNGEPMWHQIIRNIQSHHGVDGNYINLGYLRHVPKRGYEATPSGRNYLKKLGL